MGARAGIMLAVLCCLSCGGQEREIAVETGESRDLYWNVITREGKDYVTDRAGNEVILEPCRRIVVISPGAVETLYMLGAEDAIAAISSGRDPVWPEEKTRLLPDIGNAARPSLEAVMEKDPDLVIGNAMNAAFIADLSARGYRALIHGADSMEDIFNSILVLGRLAGRAAAAETLAAQARARFAGLRDGIKRNGPALKGAFLYSVNPVTAFTGASLAGEILDILGVENIAADLDAAQPILSAEYILAEDPDFLFGAMSITKEEDILAADPVIPLTRAGRERNIRIIPSSLLLRPSPRIMDTLDELQKEVRAYER